MEEHVFTHTAAQTTAYVQEVTDGVPGQVYNLVGSRVEIGSGAKGQIPAASLGICAGGHAVLRPCGDSWTVMDNLSPYGLYLNGCKLLPMARYLLTHDCEISLGPPNRSYFRMKYALCSSKRNTTYTTNWDQYFTTEAARLNNSMASTIFSSGNIASNPLSVWYGPPVLSDGQGDGTTTGSNTARSETHEENNEYGALSRELGRSSCRTADDVSLNRRVNGSDDVSRNQRVNRADDITTSTAGFTVDGKTTHASDACSGKSLGATEDVSLALDRTRRDETADRLPLPDSPHVQSQMAPGNAESSVNSAGQRNGDQTSDLGCLHTTSRADDNQAGCSWWQATTSSGSREAKPLGNMQSAAPYTNPATEDGARSSTSAAKDISGEYGTSETVNHIGKELVCSICEELFIKATTLGCSHTFCEYCIALWRKKVGKCPLCRLPVKKSSPSRVLDNIVDSVVKSLSQDQQNQRKQTVEERAAQREASKENVKRSASRNSRRYQPYRARGHGYSGQGSSTTLHSYYNAVLHCSVCGRTGHRASFCPQR